MVREIVIWPDPVLRQKCQEVEQVDDELRRLIDDMFETMYAAKGVGLAAPQVGVTRRVVVIDTSPSQEGAKPLALINPRITRTEGERVYEEGCLSVPGEAEEVVRADKVWFTALDRDGKEYSMEADGLLAIAVQHELDHLDGTLFVDRLSTLKRELIKRRMKRLKAEREAEKNKKKAEQSAV
ncbi:MAG: peptide deformylase [Myxococcales bacterium]|jgi:peptide deformylase